MALSLLGSATCSILDQGLNGTSNMRIAIAAWEKGASGRAQGWAGEKDDRNDRAMYPRKSQLEATWGSFPKKHPSELTGIS